MVRRSSGSIHDLLSATCSGGRDNRVNISLPYRREQNHFPDFQGEIVVFLFITE